MKFLEKLFNDELNESGEIEIYGSIFYRDDIFKKMEEETYYIAFNEWKEDRKKTLLEKADEILSKYNNNGRFETLKNIYRQGNMIPFIGAGMSMSSGYAGWTRFLYQLREETRVSEDSLNTLISQGKYEEAAQALFDDMPSNAFNETLENEYSVDKEIAGCIQYLPYIFDNQVITTNFDCLLERCYTNKETSFKKIITGVDSQEIARLRVRENLLLIKLHGEADSATKRVLIKEEYDRHYTGSNTLQNCIFSISQQSLLFLGCSLGVDRTIQALIDIADERGHDNIPRHYAFLPLTDGDDRLARRDKLAESNIFPIWYDGDDDHDTCIEALLLKLSEGVVDD